MAHVGQELRLHARGLLGFVPGALDGLGGLPLVGDVLHQPDHALVGVVGVDGAADEVALEGRAVLALQFQVALVGFAPLDDRIGLGTDRLVVGVVDVQDPGVLAEQLVGPVAE